MCYQCVSWYNQLCWADLFYDHELLQLHISCHSHCLTNDCVLLKHWQLLHTVRKLLLLPGIKGMGSKSLCYMLKGNWGKAFMNRRSCYTVRAHDKNAFIKFDATSNFSLFNCVGDHVKVHQTWPAKKSNSSTKSPSRHICKCVPSQSREPWCWFIFTLSKYSHTWIRFVLCSIFSIPWIFFYLKASAQHAVPITESSHTWCGPYCSSVEANPRPSLLSALFLWTLSWFQVRK